MEGPGFFVETGVAMFEERDTPRRVEPWSRRNRFGDRPSRARPLSDAARMLRGVSRDTYLGPYETSYDIRDGYGTERPIIQP
jgi:hypothetical protein